MICDKRMRYIKSEDGLDYYLFRPSLFRQYYNKAETWTPHRSRIGHKLHMLMRHLCGGYRILYLLDGQKIAGYIAFTRCGQAVIKGTTKADIFTLFITTHPDYRNKGIATKMTGEILHGIGLAYERAFTTIAETNLGTVKAAKANGYEKSYPVKRSRFLQRICQAEESGSFLYSYTSESTEMRNVVKTV